MKSFLKWLVVSGIGVALVVPLAPVLYALVGGGTVGGVACLALGTVTYWAVSTALNRVIELYKWVRDRNEPVEDTRLRVPQETVYLIDWTPTRKDGKL